MTATEKRRPGRPATGHDPTRSIRCPDDLWAEIRVVAKERGESASALVVRAAAREVRRLRRQGGDR